MIFKKAAALLTSLFKIYTTEEKGRMVNGWWGQTIGTRGEFFSRVLKTFGSLFTRLKKTSSRSHNKPTVSRETSCIDWKPRQGKSRRALVKLRVYAAMLRSDWTHWRESIDTQRPSLLQDRVTNLLLPPSPTHPVLPQSKDNEPKSHKRPPLPMHLEIRTTSLLPAQRHSVNGNVAGVYCSRPNNAGPRSK